MTMPHQLHICKLDRPLLSSTLESCHVRHPCSPGLGCTCFHFGGISILIALGTFLPSPRENKFLTRNHIKNAFWVPL